MKYIIGGIVGCVVMFVFWQYTSRKAMNEYQESMANFWRHYNHE